MWMAKLVAADGVLALVLAIALPVVIALVGAGIVALTVIAIVMVVRVYNKMDEIARPVVKVEVHT